MYIRPSCPLMKWYHLDALKQGFSLSPICLGCSWILWTVTEQVFASRVSNKRALVAAAKFKNAATTLAHSIWEIWDWEVSVSDTDPFETACNIKLHDVDSCCIMLHHIASIIFHVYIWSVSSVCWRSTCGSLPFFAIGRSGVSSPTKD